jgi:hypothetical protein
LVLQMLHSIQSMQYLEDYLKRRTVIL